MEMSSEVNFKLFLNFPFRHPCILKIGFVNLLLMIKVSLLTKKQEKKMCSALVKKTHFSLAEIEVLPDLYFALYFCLISSGLVFDFFCD